MSSTTKNYNSRYRDGCMNPGYKVLKNNFISNLFRKLTFKPQKSDRLQEETNNSFLINSDSTNSTINHKNNIDKIRAPHKVKIKSDHKGKYVPIEIPISYNEQFEISSLPSPQNRPKDIYQLEQKVDALGNQLSKMEKMLSALVQSPKVNNPIINSDGEENYMKNDLSDNKMKNDTNEDKNIVEIKINTLTQNDNTTQSSNNTTSNSTSNPSKSNSNIHIHYCTKCGRRKIHDEWCEPCDRDIFKINFPNWTSGNENIDNFIRETQILATTKFNFLEWIDFSSLTNIKPIGKGGFGEVFSAKWIDGPRTKWNAEKEVWERYSNVNVALKSLLDLKEEDFTSELFKELKSHLISNDQVTGRFTTLRTFGMTRDPESKAYMMVMTLADDGDLSAYLKKHFSTLNFVKRLEILYDMATGIYQIHKSGLMHRDLHSGNVMCQRLKDRDPGRDEEYRFVIGDLGQATPPKNDNDNRPSAHELYTTIGTWLNQYLFVPNSKIAKEFKKGDELGLKVQQSQKLHPNNASYSTYYDVQALSTKSQNFEIGDSNSFKIPDSIDYENSTNFEISDSLNHEYSTFEIPDSLDDEDSTTFEISDNIDLDDIPITPTDEASTPNNLNLEDVKAKEEIIPKSSVIEDVKSKENSALRFSQQSMGSVNFEFSIDERFNDLED
ncbi:848_t:CDS:2 [Scutellospora calospora]|uniref:848_t:CDS:1 n=1 Tax=Scutellospora calospora TaxID=85575 RepID=A0ACA9K8B4_9GLOM|nr:848_t:CDS:2 [Scutellospora calospora]